MAQDTQPISVDERNKGLTGIWKGQPWVEYVLDTPPHNSYRWNGTTLVGDGTPIFLTAAEIASPTAAILADTSATYIGPSPDYPRLFSIGTRLVGGNGQISAASLGLKFDGTDESAQWQNAMDAVYDTYAGRGGTIVCPDGRKTVLSGVWWHAGIAIVSESGGTAFIENANTTSVVGTWFELPSGATQPMLRTSRDANQGGTGEGVGSFRNTGIDGLNQRYHGGLLRGINFSGYKAVTLNSAYAHALDLKQVWNVTMEGCTFSAMRGFSINALDCNTLRIHKCNGVNTGGIFFESVSDSILTNNWFGGGAGLCNAVFWMTNGSQKNIIAESKFFNNQSNGNPGIILREYAFPVEVTVNTGTGVFTSQTNATTGSALHYFEHDTPVMFYTSGTPPTGITTTTTYYVWKLSSTTFTLCTQRSWWVAGVQTARGEITSYAGAGAGTFFINCGPGVLNGSGASLALTHDCQRNTFKGLRIDQSFGAGLLLEKSTRNTFSDIIFSEGSFGQYTSTVQSGYTVQHINPTPMAAIVLRNTATDNQFSSSILCDGTKSGTMGATSGFESRQLYGIDVDATSRPGLKLSLNSINHTVANSDTGAANYAQRDLSDKVVLGSDRFESMGGVAIALAGGNRRSGWAFDAAAEELIQAELSIPPGWRTIEIDLYWSNGGAGAGNVVWAANTGIFAEGVTLNAADGVNSSVITTAAGAQDVLTRTVLTSLTITDTAGSTYYLRIKRAATDGGDTLANDAILHSAVVYRLS